ncbi:MAG: TonB-dependent receptor plug domain-containing protein [Flavobacteriales bacterium]
MERKRLVLMGIFAFVAFFAKAQTSVLVLDAEMQPIPGSSIFQVDLGLSSPDRPVGVTNGKGVWQHAGPCTDSIQIKISAIGYEAQVLQLPCGEQQIIHLQSDVILLSGASVVGSLAPMSLKESPIRTQVISGQSLRQMPADDALEALDFTNGIRESIGCGVCGTQDIHINGLEGVYTLVLVDGVPLLGGLASAYALDGLPLSMVQHVEVIQGPASARFGSQAVGGVINVMLEPVENGRPAFRFRQDAHGRLVTSAVWSNPGKTWQFGADGQRFLRRIDDNGDGMTDAPNIKRLVLTARHVREKGSRRTRWLLRAMGEQRFGGQVEFEEDDRGGTLRYGERIDLLRAELIFGQNVDPDKKWRLAGGGAWHGQNSTYGTTHFNAFEWVSNVDLLWSGWEISDEQQLRGGVSLLWDVYADETAVSSDMNWLLPAFFLEESGKSNDLSWIVGVRAEQPIDFVEDSDLPTLPILAPRINVKWALLPQLDSRLNVGRGYRRIHLFTEEHASLDGSRRIQVQGSLKPELSWNANWSANWTLGTENRVSNWTWSLFATQFKNRLYADFNSEPNAIVYRNLPGLGRTRGMGLDGHGTLASGWSWTLGGTWMRSEIQKDESNEVHPLEFAPRWTGNADVSHQHGRWAFKLQAQVVGPMRLPIVDGLPWDSTPYGLVHAGLGRELGNHMMWIGMKNLTNTSQPLPLISADDPFSDDFDASRIYAPIEGARAYIEWSFGF